jgi:hypothetical protein
VKNWLELAETAFPSSLREAARGAALNLQPFFDYRYRLRSTEVSSCGGPVEIPVRINFIGMSLDRINDTNASDVLACCLCTRSTDGYLRQAALQRIIHCAECWAIPFVVLLSAEYVVEISGDLVSALPDLAREPYANFVLENRPLMRKLRARAISYWDVYYRVQYPERSSYPGLVFLRSIESWAG